MDVQIIYKCIHMLINSENIEAYQVLNKIIVSYKVKFRPQI